MLPLQSGRSLVAQQVVPALLATAGVTGDQHLGPGSWLCVWESSAAAGDGSWKQTAAPRHLAPLLARYQVGAWPYIGTFPSVAIQLLQPVSPVVMHVSPPGGA